MPKMRSVWISAGGNVGDVQSTFISALQDIDSDEHNNVVNVSSLYLTKAWGNEDQEDFLNIAFEIETAFDPEGLLKFCQNIEAKYKRQRLVHWGPRTLDLDLLVFEGVKTYKSHDLTLPHSFVTQRIFVLEPLNEIAPSLMINGQSVAQWRKKVSDEGIDKLNTAYNWWKVEKHK